MSILGVLVCAVSVAFFKLAALGVDPFQSFMSGIDQLIPISFGTLYVIVNVVMLLFAFVFDRHYFGIATFINLFLLGYVVQFTLDVLTMVFPAPAPALRVIFFVFGFVVLCLGSSIYITADMGVSTYDAVALIMSGTWHWGQFQYIRVATDLACVVLGIALYLLGGGAAGQISAFVGVGTILTAFFMGPLIDFFNRKVAIPLRDR